MSGGDSLYGSMGEPQYGLVGPGRKTKKPKKAPTKKRQAYAVCKNSDLTEGRGHRVIEAICESEVTASRLSKGIDVQGSDGKVIPVTVYYNLENDDPQWRTWFFGPVRLVRPTAEDEKTEKLLQEKNVKNAAARRAMLRAKELGLTDEEIDSIANFKEDSDAG